MLFKIYFIATKIFLCDFMTFEIVKFIMRKSWPLA